MSPPVRESAKYIMPFVDSLNNANRSFTYVDVNPEQVIEQDSGGRNKAPGFL